MLLALIREAECVGCAKCLSACPVDAIVGAPQFLHNVLTQECIGCGLCVAPCPMDCIDMIENPQKETTLEGAQLAKTRYQARQKRLIAKERPKLECTSDPENKLKIQSEIQAAVKRVQEHRAHKSSYEYSKTI
jgi:Na+-translocating ferredoxin:NAD+ oxidoreductase subunit B